MDKEDEIDLRRKLSESLEECEKLRDENAKLKALLRSSSLKPPSSQQSLQNTKPEVSKRTPFLKSDLSPNAKVSLYKSLFRGREDVYAIRWESLKLNHSEVRSLRTVGCGLFGGFTYCYLY